jgi:hypothetical protein
MIAQSPVSGGRSGTPPLETLKAFYSIGGAGYVKLKQLCYLPSHKDPASLPGYKQVSQ